MKSAYKSFPSHIYVHWPFCKNKCHYCDFVALEKHDAFQQRYHKALCKEMEVFLSSCQDHEMKKVDTLFFGGGTPSLYPLDLMAEFFQLLEKEVTFSSAPEITLEVNPGGITQERLAAWKSFGINRLSIGVQVLDEDVLTKLNRPQKNIDVFHLMSLAPFYFSNLSVDLILGLPGVTDEIWQQTLEQAMTWPINHISVYFLTVHENTLLYHKIKKGQVFIKPDDEMVAQYEKTASFLEKNGFEHYEISNYAKPGYQSRHNQAYWDRKPYKGLGLGASSFDGMSRNTNEKNLSRYCDYWLEGKALPFARSSEQTEVLTEKQVFLEKFMLGLRQKQGINLHDVIYCLTTEELLNLKNKIKELKKRSLIEENEQRICLTNKGMALENEVIHYLI